MSVRNALIDLHAAVLEVLKERVSMEEDEVVYDSNGLGKKTGNKIKVCDVQTLNVAIKFLKDNQVVAIDSNTKAVDELREKLAQRNKKRIELKLDAAEEDG